MSTTVRTFQYTGPDDVDMENYVDPGAVVSAAPSILLYKVATVDDAAWLDLKSEYIKRGWLHIGDGDQAPALTTFAQTYSTTATTVSTPAAFTAPGITSAYDGINGALGSNCARAVDLNDLATRCATLEAEAVAARARAVELLGLVNALVDAMQAHGIAL